MIGELPDIPRVYTALAQWLSCVVFVSVCDERRLRGPALVAIGMFFLVMQSALLITTVRAQNLLWLIFMALSLMLMFALIYATCRIPIKDACYYAVHAFVLAEFTASLQWQIHCFIWPRSDAPLIRAAFLLLAVYAAVFIVVWLFVRRFVGRGGVLNVTNRHLFAVAAITVSVFIVSNLGFLTARTPFSGHYHREIFNIRTIMGLCGLLFLGVYNLARRDLLVQWELGAVQGILRSQFEQYQHYRDSQDFINRNYHDLKHKIAYLKAEEDSGRRSVFLKAMEKEIKEYEAQFKTGNPVLDTLLTSSGFACAENSISLTCIADGALLNFMDVVDICTVFGNALDNAVEHAKRIEDPEKRLIHVTVFSKQDHLIIRFENYMEGVLSLDGDLPATTKQDAQHHGFGLKSVKYVAEKYLGTMNVEENNSWFLLQVVIPRERSERA